MQLLKLKIVSKLLELEKDLGSEVIEELPGDLTDIFMKKAWKASMRVLCWEKSVWVL